MEPEREKNQKGNRKSTGTGKCKETEVAPELERAPERECRKKHQQYRRAVLEAVTGKRVRSPT